MSNSGNSGGANQGGGGGAGGGGPKPGSVPANPKWPTKNGTDNPSGDKRGNNPPKK